MILFPETHEATREIGRILESMQIPYAVGGAIGMQFLGHVRGTRDVDVLILLPALRSQEFVDALNAAGFTLRGEQDRDVPVEVPPLVRSQREVGYARVLSPPWATSSAR